MALKTPDGLGKCHPGLVYLRYRVEKNDIDLMDKSFESILGCTVDHYRPFYGLQGSRMGECKNFNSRDHEHTHYQ